MQPAIIRAQMPPPNQAKAVFGGNRKVSAERRQIFHRHFRRTVDKTVLRFEAFWQARCERAHIIAIGLGFNLVQCNIMG